MILLTGRGGGEKINDLRHLVAFPPTGRRLGIEVLDGGERMEVRHVSGRDVTTRGEREVTW